MKTFDLCRCSPKILSDTAADFTVTFNKNLEGDLHIWIRDDFRTDYDDLPIVDLSEAKRHLPELKKLEQELAARNVAHLTYNAQAKEWEG